MALKCGIVGLPNVGKSTIFNALTSANALAANYPFATKDPNIGMIVVPDSRLRKIGELAKSKAIIPTTIEIVDIAGLIKGASKGEGLGNQFLGNIREVNAIIHVIRCFEDENIMHVEGSIDPVRDKEVINYELLLKDIETVEKKVDKYEKAAKSAKPDDVKNLQFAQDILAHLNEGKPARSFQCQSEPQKQDLARLFLLTSKPVLYVLNVDEDSAVHGNKYTETLIKSIQNDNSEVILLSAEIESSIRELEDEEDRTLFLSEIGLEESAMNRVIQSAYDLLKLITFFTAGERETHAWTLRKGFKAPRAARAIHSDFERGFIRAEVIRAEDYISYGSEFAVKEAGKMKIEGREYVVQDGDVIFFRFNV